VVAGLHKDFRIFVSLIFLLQGLSMNILDLGCGNRKLPGSIGIDINSNTDADIVHNLNEFPYPFEDSAFDEIYADNVIEHLDDVLNVMEELQRISKPNALIKIIVPYFRAKWAFIDPTHKHFFTVDSLSYFDSSHIHNKLFNYSHATFRVEKIVFNEGLVCGTFKSLLVQVANRWPVRYETYLSHLFPLDQLSFYLRNDK